MNPKNQKTLVTKKKLSFTSRDDVKNLIERAKISLDRKKTAQFNKKKKLTISEVKFDNNVIMNNPYIQKKIMNTTQNYSFKSNLIDGKKSSVENLGIITLQLSSLLNFSGKENVSKNKILKKEKLNQKQICQISSQSTLSSNSELIF